MIDVVTDLLGEIVEVYGWRDGYSTDQGYNSLVARGTVRAVYVVEHHLRLLIEHNLGWDSLAYDDRTKDGGFGTYSLHEGRARVVQRCMHCGSWDQKARLAAAYPNEGLEKAWTHKKDEGCKKVGHGG